MYKKRIKSAMAIALTVSMTVPGVLPAGNGTWKVLDSSAAEGDEENATPSNATPSNVTWGNGDSAQKFETVKNPGGDETPTIIANSKPILKLRGYKDAEGKWQVVDTTEAVGRARTAEVEDEDLEYLYFKDSNRNGKLDDYENWTLEDEERAKDLVSKMTIDDLVGMMVINSRNPSNGTGKTDETGLLDENEKIQISDVEQIFGGQATNTYGTTDTITKLGLRHFILRANPDPDVLAAWINQMNIVAEKTKLGIPVLVDSN